MNLEGTNKRRSHHATKVHDEILSFCLFGVPSYTACAGSLFSLGNAIINATLLDLSLTLASHTTSQCLLVPIFPSKPKAAGAIATNHDSGPDAARS